MALLTAANRGIPISEFTPMQIKQAVVGYGGANKEQVTFMVQKLLNIRTKPKTGRRCRRFGGGDLRAAYGGNEKMAGVEIT